jgi:hypothetical protein
MVIKETADISPLNCLANLLQTGPPLLSALVALIRDYEDYADFVALIREYLPEHETEILRHTAPGGQIATFASRFQDRYFPLSCSLLDGMAEDYACLTRAIPVVPEGLDYYQQGEPWNLRDGLMLMTYLLQEEQVDAVLVALSEACAELVPQKLLECAPRLNKIELHRLLNGTRFEGLAIWADYWEHDTGNILLDVCYEDCPEEPCWCREEVESLTQEWQRSEVLLNKIHDLAEWLEEDPEIRFKEFIQFIEQRKGEC